MESNLSSQGSSRRVFQRLPRHLRRRAMSHNYHRLPARLRAAAKQEMEEGVSRKARRRSAHMVKDHWLETHIWHAKRMRMEDKWGYRLAMTTVDRGNRAAYRSMAHGCTIYDSSYYQCLEFTDPNIVADPNRVGWFKKDVPIRYLKFNDTVWAWVHPALGKSEEVDIGKELCLFELRGPKAHSILSSILTDKGDSVWSDLFDLRTAASLPRGCVIALDAGDPRTMSPPAKRHKTDMELATIIATPWQVHSNIWDADARREAREAKTAADDALAKARGKRLFKDAIGTDAVIPVLLIQHPGVDGFGSGWDLIVPAGWGQVFFSAAVAKGAHAIGLEERHAIHTEQLLPHYPHDTPESSEAVATAQQLINEYLKRPKAKRPNYVKLNSASAFAPPWRSLLDLTPSQFDEWAQMVKDVSFAPPPPLPLERLVMVSVLVDGHGKPTPRSVICMPMPGDTDTIDEPVNDTGAFRPLIRKPIGYVTSGGYSLARGHGAGIGFCVASAIEALGDFAYMRTVTSHTYYKCMINVR